MKAILTMCPNIKSVIMKSYDGGNDETWLEVLSKSSHQIEALHVLEATFKGPNLCQYLLQPITGNRLSFLDIREMCHFRMSWLQKIKKNCQNLQKLIIGINTKHLANALQLQTIDVIKDFNLENGDGKDDPELKHLELFHLVGPFGPDVTSYMIKGANHIKNLALVINWMDPSYCSVQPSSDKDYIGTEYLKELLKVNLLDQITQLHLSGRDKKSRAKLDKECVGYVLTTFGATLKHLGNFYYWNLKNERWNLINEITAQNRSIVMEEHLKSGKGEKIDFHKKYVEDRLTFSCQDPNSLISEQYDDNRHGFMADLFDVIAGLHGFLEPNGAPDEQSDSDESFMESDDGEDVFEEEGDLNLWMGDD